MRLGREQSRPALPNAQPLGQAVVLDEGGILAVRGAESRRKAFILQVLMKALDLSVLMTGRHEIDIHFVNYARNEPDDKSRKGFVADENPVPVSGMKADVVIPAGFRVTKVEMITPEADEPETLPIEQHAGRVQFTVPEILVYGVARIYLERGEMTRSEVHDRRGRLSSMVRQYRANTRYSPG